MNFIFFYDSNIDTFNSYKTRLTHYFKSKYNLNNKYIEVDISKDKKAITNYILTHVPTIKIYDNSQCLLEECSPFNNQYLDIIEKYYQSI